MVYTGIYNVESFTLYFLVASTEFFIDKSLIQKKKKQKKSRFFLQFLLDDRMIRIRTSDSRIREAQNPTDPKRYRYPFQRQFL